MTGVFYFPLQQMHKEAEGTQILQYFKTPCSVYPPEICFCHARRKPHHLFFQEGALSFATRLLNKSLPQEQQHRPSCHAQGMPAVVLTGYLYPSTFRHHLC